MSGGREGEGDEKRDGARKEWGESSYQPWFALDGLKLLTLGV